MAIVPELPTTMPEPPTRTNVRYCVPHRTVAARGATLIELVIAVVIFSVASAGIVSVYIETTASSADPQIRAQARAIAEAYMDEILLQPYCEDPQRPTPCNAETAGGGAETGENRGSFDDVYDYKAINGEDPTDQTGTSIGGLSDYDVGVTVDGDPQAEDTAVITVTVTHDSGKIDFELLSEREPY